MSKIALKVCGMRDQDNINDIVEQIAPDYLGFIFYPKSPRFVGLEFNRESIQNLPNNVSKVGVFVNAIPREIIEFSRIYGMNFAQLHGNESPELCKEVKEAGIKVIKAFSVADDFDFEQLKAYESVVDYFLFDTKGEAHGGNGVRFNWEVLNNYNSTVPFFLSGGIDIKSVKELSKLKHLPIAAIDVNSKFEMAPAFKDVEKLKDLVSNLNEINA